MRRALGLLLAMLVLLPLAPAGAADPQQDLQAAAAALEQREYGPALRLVNRAISSGRLGQEGLYSALYDRGLAHKGLGQVQRALADFNRVIELNPAHAGAHIERGRIHTVLGDDRRALKEFSRALAINPRSLVALRESGRLLAKQKNYRRALDDFARLKALAPNLYWGYLEAGLALEKQGRYGKAVAELRHAWRLEPSLAIKKALDRVGNKLAPGR